MSGTVSRICTFPKQVSLAGFRDMQLQRAAWCGLKKPPLNSIQLDVEDFFEFGGAQRLKHHDLVDAVHELRGEPSPCRFHSARRNSFAQPLVFAIRGCKSE